MTIHIPAKATFISITPHQRRQIEGLIESLIAMLDTIDGNENDEDDGCDELSFGDPQFGEREVDEDFEQDAGDEPEFDPAEDGIADFDALQDENLYCLSFAFDKSGKDIADRLLHERISAERIPVTQPDGKVRMVTRQP